MLRKCIEALAYAKAPEFVKDCDRILSNPLYSVLLQRRLFNLCVHLDTMAFCSAHICFNAFFGNLFILCEIMRYAYASRLPVRYADSIG